MVVNTSFSNAIPSIRAFNRASAQQVASRLLMQFTKIVPTSTNHPISLVKMVDAVVNKGFTRDS